VESWTMAPLLLDGAETIPKRLCKYPITESPSCAMLSD